MCNGKITKMYTVTDSSKINKDNNNLRVQISSRRINLKFCQTHFLKFSRVERIEVKPKQQMKK